MNTEDYVNLIDSARDQLAPNEHLIENCASHLKMSLAWTGFFLTTGVGENCSVLLRGSYGAAVESISLLAMGMLRPSVLSLRSHYELSLQFLFYKDHPVEWRNVESFRFQPALPAVNKKYLKDSFPWFDERFKELAKKKKRKHEDCYDLLSGVAHGTALNSISQASKPKDLIEDSQTLAQAEEIFLSTAEFLNDVHISQFESNWLSLPPAIKDCIALRFTNGKANSILKM